MTPTTTQWIEIKDDNDVIVRWETPGQSLEGIFLGGKPSGDKKNLLFEITDPDGKPHKTWETLVLKEKLSKVPVGAYVRIEYDGVNGKTKKFSVRHRPA